MSLEYTESPIMDAELYDVQSDHDRNTQELLAEEQEPKNLIDTCDFSPTATPSENHAVNDTHLTPKEFNSDSLEKEDLFQQEDSTFHLDIIVKRIKVLEAQQSHLTRKCVKQEKKIQSQEKKITDILSKISGPPSAQQPSHSSKADAETSARKAKNSPGPTKRSRSAADKKDVSTPNRGKVPATIEVNHDQVTPKLHKSTGSVKLASLIGDPKVVILFHGKGSADQSNYRLEIETLHGVISDDGTACHTHLVSVNEECGRCVKALVALARGVPIVNIDWISASFKNKEWLHTRSYLCRDVPRPSVSRRQVLSELSSAVVGVYGNTKPGFSDLSLIIEGLGGHSKEITMATRRKKEDVNILVIPKDFQLSTLRSEVEHMPALKFVITDENLKEVIWEGDRSLIQKLDFSETNVSRNTDEQLTGHKGMPFLQEVPFSQQNVTRPMRIYPTSASSFPESKDGTYPAIRVGRNPASCAYLLPYEGVSRIHFALQLVKDVNQLKLYIEDQGSTNGIFVNKQKRLGRTEVHENDVILVGGGAGLEDGAFLDDTMKTEHSARFVVKIDSKFSD